jgi:hypothetical protein
MGKGARHVQGSIVSGIDQSCASALCRDIFFASAEVVRISASFAFCAWVPVHPMSGADLENLGELPGTSEHRLCGLAGDATLCQHVAAVVGQGGSPSSTVTSPRRASLAITSWPIFCGGVNARPVVGKVSR